MASRPPPNGSPSNQGGTSSSLTPPAGTGSGQPTNLSRNTEVNENASSPQQDPQSSQAGAAPKKKKHRAGKKRRNRRQSFAPPLSDAGTEDAQASQSTRDLLDVPEVPPKRNSSFYGRGNLSSTSLESEALLDHRDHPPMRPRRQSILQGSFGPRGAQNEGPTSNRPSYSSPYHSHQGQAHEQRPRYSHAHVSSGGESDEERTNDKTPLLSTSGGRDRPSSSGFNYGGFGSRPVASRHASRNRRSSNATSTSSRQRRRVPNRIPSSAQGEYDVNNPPSVPSSPKLRPEMGFDDVMVGEYAASKSPNTRRSEGLMNKDAVINIDGDDTLDRFGKGSSPTSPRNNALDHRRRTIALPAEEDVCFPTEGLSEIGDEEYQERPNGHYRDQPRRRRGRDWPDLSVLDDWSREEKEERSEGLRQRKISEPVLVGGRLRPQKAGWHRTEEDAPYRFTYFNEEFQSTIHSQTISELLQPGQSFRDLFIPDPPELSDESSDEEDDTFSRQDTASEQQSAPTNNNSRVHTRQSSLIGDQKSPTRDSSGDATPSQSQVPKSKPKRYGSRPTFWLDVLSPTDAEMKIIAKTFGIHPLTAEDILVQEAREKVELFRNYYLVNYRTFEQDMNNENFLEPVDMYVVVFREGVISFHFSMTPHPANVRRRIRQLKDYLILSSDWISYAIIDDITDVFAPLIQHCEEEVDDIDDAILRMHAKEDDQVEKSSSSQNEKKSEVGQDNVASGGDMLRRVGDARKKVMGLYRLLGNKADVIKGFAKRCNEQWDVAPRSEIGLYLGDIQDHIVTMTSNLSHYEK
ncbi:MAG: CorA metal ion transporter [Pycnora praestabilis]|nr:MAG: CorA metal ion transporter [Pycnora praestabilis]